ncbi:MAG: YtxH domain-containing protein [Chloroflexota bacterium]
MRRYSNFILGAAAGGFVGAMIAILLAPSSGKELRRRIGERTQQVRIELQEAAKQRRTELEAHLAELRAPRHKTTE